MSGSGLLDRIVATKRAEVSGGGPVTPGARDFSRRDVVATLQRGGEGRGRGPLRLIAEIKFKSPSAGPLSRALDAPSRALAYAEAGAALISVLCDAEYFDGGFAHLLAAREALDRAGRPTPLLAKEFVIDGAQIEWAAAHGADAVLLIARIVDAARLAELSREARSAGLEPLVEVVNEAELDAALAAGARVVGVNARDLDTLQMDMARAAQVTARIPDEVVAVHLSGVSRPDDVRAIAGGRADAALVGEALMRKDDPRAALAALLAAGGGVRTIS